MYMVVSVVIVSPYYNNSHFIPIQIKSFRKYLHMCNWKLVIVDDYNENTKNVLTNEKEDIKAVCDRFPDEVDYIRFPYEHKYQVNQAPEKHRNLLNYITREVSQMYKDKFTYLLSLDADMAFVKHLDVEQMVSGYDMIASKRIQTLSSYQFCPGAPAIHYPWVHCMFLNIQKITNIHEINMGAIPETTMDTGSLFYLFLRKNPHYKCKYLTCVGGTNRLNIFNDFEFFLDNYIIHYGTGTMWAGDTNKLQTITNDVRKFTEYVDKGLSNDDEQLIEQTKICLYTQQTYRDFSTPIVTDCQLRAFGLL